ncbi:MAG: hypothetical protein KDJ65_01110 [Anaerolineae bacterium]|nr:hypothetical protein [Anaerolineae bacterium]
MSYREPAARNSLNPVMDAPQDATPRHQVLITTGEWRWAVGWALLILVASALPFLSAWAMTPPGWNFTGILVNPLDGHTYVAKIEQGAEGHWLFQLTYTPEPHDGVFLFPFYLGLGHIARLTSASLVLVFHLARLIIGLGLLLTVYRFNAHITANIAERRLAYLLVGTASGLGWLGVAFGAFPIDFWVPEAFVHYSLHTNPHFPLGLTLMLLILMYIIWPPQIQHIAWILAPSLLAVLLAFVLPFALIIVWLLSALFIGRKVLIDRGRLPWLHIWPTLGVVGASLPVVGYQYWISVTNPILAGWNAQNITSTPPVTDVIFGFGIIGGLALINAISIMWWRRREASEGEWLLCLWVISSIVLLYVPFPLQRRFITGLHIPLAILAAMGLLRWLAQSKLRESFQRMIVLGVIVMGLLGTLIVWGLPLLLIAQQPVDSPTASLLFVRDDETAAFEWLRDNVEPDDIILASPRIGMLIPGQTGARAFYGHPFETIEAQDKKAQVEAFYKGEQVSTSPESDYIFYGFSEQAIGQPQLLQELPVVFSNGDVRIYKSQQEH